MGQFMMRGMAITGYMRFREHFCPKDLLRQRELAAGFLYQHVMPWSDKEMFHSRVFWAAVFKEMELLEAPDDYRGLLYGYIELKTYAKKKRWAMDWERPVQTKRKEDLWALAQATSLEEPDKSRLFCLLMAGYSLADRSLESCPLTYQEAEAAYRRVRSAPEAADSWQTFSGEGEITLAARKEPYRILLGQGAWEKLKKGESIRQRKITAGSHAQGNSNVPVTLMLYKTPEDPAPREMTVYAGDYRYANFVGEIPVWIHPVCQDSASCRMERRGSTIRYLDKKHAFHSDDFDCSNLDIVGFAVEQTAAGWILLLPGGRIDDFQYTMRLTKTHYPKQDIVEVAFRGSEGLLLDHRGRVYSILESRWTAEGVTALEEYSAATERSKNE